MMQASTLDFAAAATATTPGDAAASRPWAQRPAGTTTAILDARGTVRFCGDPQLFGGLRHEIDDQPIRRFMPTLVLPEIALGASAWSANEGAAAPWARHLLRTLDGRSTVVEVSLRQLALDCEVALLMMIRSPQDERTAPRSIDCLIASAERNSEAICITDRDGHIVFINCACELLTGYTSAEVRGVTAAPFRTDSRERPCCRDLPAALLDGREVRTIFDNCTKDGIVYREEQCIRPFVGVNGEVSHFVASCRSLDGAIAPGSLPAEVVDDAASTRRSRHAPRLPRKGGSSLLDTAVASTGDPSCLDSMPNASTRCPAR